MLALQLFAFALLATAQARFIHLPYLKFQPYDIDIGNFRRDDFKDVVPEPHFESIHPLYVNRVRRQLSSMSMNSDGTEHFNHKVPIAEGENNVVSAFGSLSQYPSSDGATIGKLGYGGGLALDNINGHGLSLSGQHIPDFGNQATVAGRVALLNTPDHKLETNAFLTRTMPNVPDNPSFNTYGGSMDYTFKDKVGGSLGMAYTDLFKKTDYSAMGKLNMYRSPTSSLDLSAGVTKSVSPFSVFNENWHPRAEIGFTKWF